MKRETLRAMVVAVVAFSVLFFGIVKGSAVAGPVMMINKGGDKVTLPGSQISYDIDYENVGDADALTVVITDTLPSDTTFVSASGGCTEAAGVVTCDVGTVGAGVDSTRTITVDVNADAPVGPSLINSASLSYEDGVSSFTVNAEDFITTVTGMEMTVYGQRFVSPGEDMAYVVIYRNISDETPIGEDCMNVTVTADYSSSIVEVSDTWGPQNVLAGNYGHFNFSVTVAPDATVGAELTSIFTMSYTHSGGVVAQAIKEVKTRVYESYLTELVSPIRVPVGHVEFFPDGNKIVFLNWSVLSNDDIYIINTDGSGLAQLTTDYNCDSQPQISADGTKIAFKTNRNEGTHPDEPHNNADIYIMNADGSNKVRLTDDPGCQVAPFLSPDGTKVVYMDDMDSPENQQLSSGSRLWVVNSDGLSDPIMLPASPGNEDENIGLGSNANRRVAWSPDSEWIFFRQGCNSNADHELYKVKADGTEFTQLTFDGEMIQWLVINRDGSKILCREGCDPNVNMVVMDADGYNKRVIASQFSDNVEIGDPHWSPDDRWITYQQEGMSGLTGDAEIWITDSRGRFTGMLTSLYDDRPPKWSPVGDRILFESRWPYRPMVSESRAFFINFDTSDPDGDGLANWEEDIVGSLINDPDTDGDRVDDGTEFDLGTNPLVASDFGVTPASPTIVSPADGSCVNDSTVATDITCAQGSCEERLDGGGWQACGTGFSGVADGSHTVGGHCIVDGVVSDLTTSSFDVDTVPSAAPTITAPADDSDVDSSTVATEITCAEGSCEERLDGGAWQACGSGFSGVTDGSHTIGGRCVDPCDNASALATSSIEVDTEGPPPPPAGDDGCGCMVIGEAGTASNYGNIAGMALIYLFPVTLILMRMRKVYRRSKAA